jgi:cytochrome b subunit of formate dehydrogenase
MQDDEVTRSAQPPDGPPAACSDPASRYYYYLRFSAGQRSLHGFLIVTFLGLAMTGLTLRFSNTPMASSFAGAIGGFVAILFFHKLCAVVLTLAFLIHVGTMAYRIFVRKEYKYLWGPDSMVPRLKDFQDFFGHIKWFLFRGPKPEFDRYAYWDKVDYWAVFWGMAVIGLSGYAMWFAPLAARLIPGSWLNVALLIHGEEALLAVGFIFTIHIFNTDLRPGKFPMDTVIFTGRLTEKELKEHHPLEYQRLVESGELEKLRAEPPPPWLRTFAYVFGAGAILIGVITIVLIAVTLFRE